MSACVKRNVDLLRLLHKSKPALVKIILKNASPDLVRALSECCLNVLKGNIKLNAGQKTRLRRYKNILRKLAAKKLAVKTRKQLLQKGGFIGALLGPVLGVLGSLLGR